MTRVGISGHRGLPSETAALVENALLSELAERKGVIGVSCLADGADTLFAEGVLAIGGVLEVVIPAQRYRDGLPASHHSTYDRLLAQATAVYWRPFVESTSQAHMDASEFMLGVVEEMIAVWDGEAARGYGGTADVVAAARRRGLPVIVVWPDGAIRD